MNTEVKLMEVVGANWKGFMEYFEYTEEERENKRKPYSIEELYVLAKEAFNLGIETAANNAEAELVGENDPVVGEYQDAVVNYDSILKLKIQ